MADVRKNHALTIVLLKSFPHSFNFWHHYFLFMIIVHEYLIEHLLLCVVHAVIFAGYVTAFCLNFY